MFDFIEKVVYINLNHRTDRKEQIEAELSKYFPANKIIRFDAIKYPTELFENEIPQPFYWNIGACGCTKSHISVLEMAISEGWNNVLIVEDDSMWNNFDNGYSFLEQKIKEPFDVILLGSVVQHIEKSKVISAQSAHSYLVSKHYYEKLLNNYKESFQKKIAIDQYWKILQPSDNWYCIKPSMMIQRPSFSDIENKFVDYAKYF